mmetsp:Transcript_21018/g.66590  ORF Transcript_21018/g.66590 Transcript_21018/m.66590 type:complete len:102 (-) Transcript_21018:159-464(-)
MSSLVMSGASRFAAQLKVAQRALSSRRCIKQLSPTVALPSHASLCRRRSTLQVRAGEIPADNALFNENPAFAEALKEAMARTGEELDVRHTALKPSALAGG